jgi:hypothetical protein
MKRFAALAGLATVSLLLQTGCLSRAVKEGYYGVVGAQGEVYELVRLADYGVDEKPLAEYESFALEPITSDLPPEVFTSAQLALLTGQCRKAVIDSSLFLGGSKKLIGRGRVVHYEGYSFGGAMGAALGSQKALVVRMQLLDGQTNEPLGEAALVGVIKSSLRRSDEEFADGVAKALVHWLGKRTGHHEEEH